jgi:glycosyltransferase involved in cell wall biosynthesis
MKILQTISGFGAHSGGTSTCTYDLISALHAERGVVDLLTLSSKDPTDRLMGMGEEWIHALPNDAITPFGYSANMKRWMEGKMGEYDILHANGLWMYANHITCAMARKHGKPYVITPHGMLYPAALRRSYWKKWPFLKLFFHKDIMQASCLHATCKQEMEYIREFGYRGPVAIIPNPMVLPAPPSAKRSPKAKKAFGFLGRLHPIKKVENLFYGVELLKERQQECELWIMGSGLPEYEAFLKAEVERLGLRNVRFLGFVSGQEKYEKLAQLSTLFVPSDFENFGMIVTEALSVGTPVMASLGTPWEELNNQHCGWWCDRTPENIAQVMRQVLDMSAQKLDAMGERGKAMAKANFAAEEVARKVMQLYSWLLDGGQTPAFVQEI